MKRKVSVIRLLSMFLTMTLLFCLCPMLALPALAAKTEVTVTLSQTSSESKGNGFYFTVSPSDPLEYNGDWSERPLFTEGGVYLSDGTKMESPRTLVKLSSVLYYVALQDNGHVAVDDEIVYVDGVVETDTVKVTYARTAFQFDAATNTWSIVATVDGGQLTLGNTLDMDVSLTVPSAVNTGNLRVETSVGDQVTTQALPAVSADGRCHVSVSALAKDMTVPLTVRLLNGETVLSEKTTTIRQYAESIVNGDYYDVYKDAAKAMLNYGAQTQQYFDFRTTDLANKNCAYTTELDAVDPSALPDMTIDGTPTGYLGATLLLQSEITIRLYFDHAVEGGVPSGDYYCIDLPAQGADDLDAAQSVTVEGTTYNVSVLSLAKRVLNGTYNKNFTKLMQSLVLYAKAGDKLSQDLLILSPSSQNPVFPYVPLVQAYLEAEDPNVADYAEYRVNPNQPIPVVWNGTAAATGYTVLVATKSDYSDAKTYQVDADTTRVDLYNLYKSTKYYVKVSANGTDVVSESTFQTTDLGPRVMLVDGIYNVRDIGGYETCFGTTTLQGLIYRGGALNPSTLGYNYVNLTEEGKRVMSEEMGIVSELDLRRPDESFNLQESLIPGADLYYNPLGAYETGVRYNNRDEYRKCFQLLARPENYPVYFHCTGGADRTGTLSYLIGALLGYSHEDLIHDYEFTTFSVYCERNSRPGTTYTFSDMYDYLFTLEGETMTEKVETYLLSIGVTADEIYNVRAIMTGGETRELTTEMELAPHVPVEDVEPESIPNFYDYMNSEEIVTLNSSKTSVTSDLAVGYGNKVRIPLNTNTVGSNGYTDIYIGSYGVRLRGGEFRIISTAGEIARYTGLDISNRFFDNNGYLDISVTLEGNDVLYTLYARDNQGGSYTYTYTATDARIAAEVASADAKITVTISTSEVDELIMEGQKTGLVTPPTEEEEDTTPTFFDYMNSDETITLNSSNLSVTSDLAVGYGNTVRIPLNTALASGNGRLYVYIGSYGLNMRAGQLRFHINNGSDTEMQPRPDNTQCLIESNFFDDGGYMDFKVTLGETSVTFDVYAYNNYGNSYTITHTYNTGRLTTGEIASEDAKITIKIDGTVVTEAIIAP